MNAIMGGEKHTKWGEVAGMLRAHPGEWAKVAERPNRTSAVSLANSISSGKRPEFEPAGAFGSAYAPNETDPTRYDVFAGFGVKSPNSNGAAASPAYADDDGEWDDPEP